MSLPRAAMRLLLSRSALSRGVATAGQVHASASEMMRARRDPSAVARRKHLAAKRRLLIWGLSAAGALGWLVAVVVAVVRDGITAMLVVQLILLGLAVLWLGTGAVRAARDVWTRGRTVAALPPPAPTRRPVSSAARADLDRLGEYSDSLRSLVPLIGATGTADDRSVLRLRREVLEAADAVETRIRVQADELSRLQQAWRSAPVSSRDGLTTAAAGISAQVKQGVSDYGQLVAAASEAVAATSTATSAGRAELTDTADRLRGLARGMAEVAEAGGDLGTGRPATGRRGR